MKKNSYLIPRRTFLRGAAVTLGLPLLDIMNPALSYGANKKKTPSNLRLCVLYKGCGVNPNSYDIAGGTENNFELSKLLQPLKPLQKDILILRNLDAFGQRDHFDATPCFMSGLKQSAGRKAYEINYTYDQMIADEIGFNTPIKSLRLDADKPFGDNHSINHLCADKNGKPLPSLYDPQLAFDQLFRGFNSKTYRQSLTSVLDDVKDARENLKRNSSRKDLDVLDQYFTSIRDVEEKIAHMTKHGRQFKQGEFKIPKSMDLGKRIKCMLDIIALAFWSDTTRVATMKMANSNSRQHYNFMGVRDEFHYLSHFVRNRKARARYDKVNMWHISQFAYFIKKLKSYKEGEGTVFDNSLIHFGSGMKHGDYHTLADLPVILSGGAGGQLKTGRHVHYPKAVEYSNLLLNLTDMMGLKKKKIGLSNGRLTGITENANFKPRNPDDGTWKVIKDDGKKITIKGLLRTSNQSDINLYLLRLSDKTDFHIRISFLNGHAHSIDDNPGKIITLLGTYVTIKGVKTMNNVSKIIQESR